MTIQTRLTQLDESDAFLVYHNSSLYRTHAPTGEMAYRQCGSCFIRDIFKYLQLQYLFTGERGEAPYQ